MSNIDLFKVFMSPDAGKRVQDTLDSGYIGEGQKVKDFESELHRYFKVREPQYNITTVNSATSGISLLYYYLKKPRKLIDSFEYGFAEISWPGFSDKDHVLTTPLTFLATNTPIVLNGLDLRWVDVDPITLNISVEDLKNKINEHTRVVSFVHWGGNPCDLDAVVSIVRSAAKRYGKPIQIIEDCAHAFGSTYKGESVGFTRNLSVFSTQAIKHITTGDGGFVVSPYKSLSDDLRKLRWYGIDRDDPYASYRSEGDVSEVGSKYHMNDISASIGLANLEHADAVIGKHKENGLFYDKVLKDISGITVIPQLKDCESSYWVYSMHVANRDDFMRHMGEHKVIASKVHERNDKHSCFAKYKAELPGVNLATKSMCCIPSGWWVTKENREYIVDVIKKGW